VSLGTSLCLAVARHKTGCARLPAVCFSCCSFMQAPGGRRCQAARGGGDGSPPSAAIFSRWDAAEALALKDLPANCCFERRTTAAADGCLHLPISRLVVDRLADACLHSPATTPAGTNRAQLVGLWLTRAGLRRYKQALLPGRTTLATPMLFSAAYNACCPVGAFFAPAPGAAFSSLRCFTAMPWRKTTSVNGGRRRAVNARRAGRGAGRVPKLRGGRRLPAWRRRNSRRAGGWALTLRGRT